MMDQTSPTDLTAIRTALKQALDQSPLVPDGHHGALVAHFDLDRVRVAAAQRIAGDWQIGEVVEWNRRDPAPTVGVNILKTW